ncbi:MAG: NAD(P)-dependent alcohol dehydrogenase, partial [Limnothrix sp.]
MKAIAQSEYGSPDVLGIKEVSKPEMRDDKVLVKVHAASVHAGDWHLMRGTPFLIRLLFGGLLKPKIKILGTDMAGTVEAVGKEITQFQPGDEVFGELSSCGFGAFAEYVSVPEKVLAKKPNNLNFEAAATVPVSGMSALQALRDFDEIKAGQRVLINGASGGVGSYAVQIAKALGAEVTGVCSTQKMAFVRSLGADNVLDYTQTDCTQTAQPYDLIVDTAAYRSAKDFMSALTPDGIYVLVGGDTGRLLQVMLFGEWMGGKGDRQIKCLEQQSSQADLQVLTELIEAGKITPAVERCYG